MVTHQEKPEKIYNWFMVTHQEKPGKIYNRFMVTHQEKPEKNTQPVHGNTSRKT